nr:MAG TPA: hypothetical protein [Bacteriophage sp.]
MQRSTCVRDGHLTHVDLLMYNNHGLQLTV